MGHDEYFFRSRGEIEVKGKGKMSTFFLIGSKSKFVKEPNDEFVELPVVQEKSEHGTMSEQTCEQDTMTQSTGNVSANSFVKSARGTKSVTKHRTEKNGNENYKNDCTVNSNFRTVDRNILKIKVKSSTCLII